MRCKCGSSRMIKHGKYRNRKGEYQVHKCKVCGRTRIGERLR